jgi:hypothetical protein
LVIFTWLTANIVPCKKSTDLSWEGDEPSAAAAEEASAPVAEESAPLPQAETVAPAAEAALPEASIAEGEYTKEMQPSSSSSRSPWETDPVCLLLIGAEIEGCTILEAVPVEGNAPEAEVAAGAATEPAKIASGVGPEVAEEVCDDVLLESSMEVVVRSLEIQYAEPIHSAPMSETTATSRGGLELLADDLVDSATMARNLDAMRQTEQWMKVCISTLGYSIYRKC